MCGWALAIAGAPTAFVTLYIPVVKGRRHGKRVRVMDLVAWRSLTADECDRRYFS
jgi:hypothetical protein